MPHKAPRWRQTAPDRNARAPVRCKNTSAIRRRKPLKNGYNAPRIPLVIAIDLQLDCQGFEGAPGSQRAAGVKRETGAPPAMPRLILCCPRNGQQVKRCHAAPTGRGSHCASTRGKAAPRTRPSGRRPPASPDTGLRPITGAADGRPGVRRPATRPAVTARASVACSFIAAGRGRPRPTMESPCPRALALPAPPRSRPSSHSSHSSIVAPPSRASSRTIARSRCRWVPLPA